MVIPPNPPRPRRRGFLLYLVLGILAVLGILLLALDVMTRQRNRLAHRGEHGRVASRLAEGGVSYLQYRLREELAKPPPRVSDLRTPLTGERLFGFLLLSPAELEEEVSRRDLDALLAQWLDPDWRIPLDDLEDRHPGATITVALEATARRLHPESGRFHDPVEKTVELSLVVEADYRGVARAARRTYAARVVHPFPPMTSKFTLFVNRVPNPDAEFNVYENDEAGISTASPPQDPFILRNTPLGAVDDRTLDARNAANRAAGDPWADQGALREVLEHRGWVYLGTGPGNPLEVNLNLTAGPMLLDESGLPYPGERGEFFQLYPMDRGSQPSFFQVQERGVPAPFSSPLTQPDGTQRQAFVNFLFWGHFTDGAQDLSDAGLGTTLGDERSSILHLFGDDDEPSRTKVYGRVMQRYVRFGYLGVDRKVGPDATGPDDEEIQVSIREGAGYTKADFPVYERDSADPIFAYVPDEATWEQELQREASGEPFVHLHPFKTLQSGDEGPENRHYFPDIDGDGSGDLIMDPGFPRVPLDATLFRYAALFPDGYAARRDTVGIGYENFMSKVMTVDYNEMTDYMMYSSVIPPEHHPAWPERYTAADELEPLASATDVRVDFGDPLHEYLGETRMFEGDLSTFLDEEFAEVLRRRAALRLPDQGALLRRFPLATNPLTPGDPVPWLAVDQVVLVTAGGLDLPRLVFPLGGALVVAEGDVRLEGVEPRGYGMPTIVALNGDILLEGPGPYHALLAAPRGELRNAGGTPLELNGSLALGSLRADALTRGGGIRYVASADPTSYGAGVEPAYADFYQVGLSDVPVEWSPAR